MLHRFQPRVLQLPRNTPNHSKHTAFLYCIYGANRYSSRPATVHAASTLAITPCVVSIARTLQFAFLVLFCCVFSAGLGALIFAACKR
jgi:hypothetical protein